MLNEFIKSLSKSGFKAVKSKKLSKERMRCLHVAAVEFLNIHSLYYDMEEDVKGLSKMIIEESISNYLSLGILWMKWKSPSQRTWVIVSVYELNEYANGRG